MRVQDPLASPRTRPIIFPQNRSDPRYRKWDNEDLLFIFPAFSARMEDFGAVTIVLVVPNLGLLACTVHNVTIGC